MLRHVLLRRYVLHRLDRLSNATVAAWELVAHMRWTMAAPSAVARVRMLALAAVELARLLSLSGRCGC